MFEEDVSLDQRIWQTVMAIPQGKVASYGLVATRAGLPGGARRVGRALRNLASDTRVPWHRVVNAQGKISLPAGSAGAKLQRSRLEEEGVEFNLSGRINFDKFLWHE